MTCFSADSLSRECGGTEADGPVQATFARMLVAKIPLERRGVELLLQEVEASFAEYAKARKESLQKEGLDEDTVRALMMIHRKQGRHDEVRKDGERLLEEDPPLELKTDVITDIAESFTDEGRYGDAVKYLRGIFANRGNEPEDVVHNWMARLARRAKDRGP